jgi:hypothetical protein
MQFLLDHGAKVDDPDEGQYATHGRHGKWRQLGPAGRPCRRRQAAPRQGASVNAADKVLYITGPPLGRLPWRHASITLLLARMAPMAARIPRVPCARTSACAPKASRLAERRHRPFVMIVRQIGRVALDRADSRADGTFSEGGMESPVASRHWRNLPDFTAVLESGSAKRRSPRVAYAPGPARFHSRVICAPP